MLRIYKGIQPLSFQVWKSQNRGRRDFERLVGTPRSDLKKSLINEQHGLCCYCSAKISESTSHIEHIKPKSRYASLMFSYQNLIASCNGSNGEKNSCGHKKGDWYVDGLFVSPLDENCEIHFGYLPNGKIIAANISDVAAKATIDHLNLNSYELEQARMALFDAIMLNGDDEESAKNELETYLRLKSSGEPAPFCNVIITALTCFVQ